MPSSCGTSRPARRTCSPSTRRGRDQRRRRSARASHAGPARHLLDPRAARRPAAITVGLVGDIAHSRTARSNLWGLAQARRQGDPLRPADARLATAGGNSAWRCRTTSTRSCRGATCSTSCGSSSSGRTRGRFPSVREYAHLYAMTRERLKRAKKDLLILAPGPINRGVEVTAEVADCPQSLILGQVTNGLAVRMARALADLRAAAGGTGGRPAAATGPDEDRLMGTLLIRGGTGGRSLAGHRPHRRRARPRRAGGRASATPGPSRSARPTRRSTPPGSWWRPASSTCTCTSASRAARRTRRSRPARGRRSPAASRASPASPTPSRRSTRRPTVEFIHQKAARADTCNVFVVACVSRDREGKELAEIGQLVEAGRRGLQRRRCPGLRRGADAAGLRILPHVRQADPRPRGGARALARRRDARGARVARARPRRACRPPPRR